MTVRKHKVLIAFGLLIVVLAVLYFASNWASSRKLGQYQSSIQSFYDPPRPLPSRTPGTLIRTEAMTITVPGGGSAYRILYVSQAPDGKPAVSSGMVFVPRTPAPAGGRKVVAWAHGTLGFGDDCTPSRSQKPLGDTTNWLDGMMQRGWVVVATDYAGLGTPGDPYYLVGKSEAADVLNSVRAARNFDKASAGNRFVAWGHSQGGHSALFTAVYASSYAPELKLVGVAAAAPAAELPALFAQQYDKVVAWAIGPSASVSWPLVYPDLPLRPVLSKKGLKDYRNLAFGCIEQEKGELALAAFTGEEFFEVNPMSNAAWYSVASRQTPPLSKIKVPVYVAQGLSDTVVLPNTTALFVKKACSSGVNITADWLGDTTHLQVAMVAGPSVVDWIQDRFNGVPATNSCAQPLPVLPARVPPAP